MSAASKHAILFLNDIAYPLRGKTIIADKGYLSEQRQKELWQTYHIKLIVPKRKNQRPKQSFPAVFRRVRKRIETLFSQLSDQSQEKRS